MTKLCQVLGDKVKFTDKDGKEHTLRPFDMNDVIDLEERIGGNIARLNKDHFNLKNFVYFIWLTGYFFQWFTSLSKNKYIFK